jgi:hypothetical protein
VEIDGIIGARISRILASLKALLADAIVNDGANRSARSIASESVIVSARAAVATKRSTIAALAAKLLNRPERFHLEKATCPSCARIRL